MVKYQASHHHVSCQERMLYFSSIYLKRLTQPRDLLLTNQSYRRRKNTTTTTTTNSTAVTKCHTVSADLTDLLLMDIP